MPGNPFVIYDGPTVVRQQGQMTGGGDSVAGVTVTGTPTANQVLTATSATAANWQAGGGGGGFAIGSSYIVLQPVAQAGRAMGAGTNLSWQTPTLVGTDLALHAGGVLVDILTTGFYSLNCMVALTGAPNQVQLAYAGSLEGGFNAIDNYLSADPTVGAYDICLAYPCLKLSNGDSVSFQAFADNATSTGTYAVLGSPGGLQVVRLA